MFKDYYFNTLTQKLSLSRFYNFLFWKYRTYSWQAAHRLGDRVRLESHRPVQPV